MSNEQKVIRGNLTSKPELIEFFKFLDKWTKKEDLEKPYDKRLYYHGFKQAAMRQFHVKSQQTIDARCRRFPNGITEASKHHAGVQSVVYEKWEKTDCYQAIKQHTECWIQHKDGSGELTVKGKKYEAHLEKVFEMTHKDPLDLDLNEWLVFWGNPSKSVGTAPPKFTDPMTGRVSYAAAGSFRFAMQRSHATDIQQLIITKDGRFDTNNLKRPKGLHKEEFQSEEQIKALPEFFQSTEILMLDYCGVIFGGRFDALKDVTPADVKREFHQIHFYEGKVNKDVDKPIYEPETSFIWQYITDKRLAKNQKLFSKSISYYNAELTKAGKAMGKKYPELELKNDKDEEWMLTTHRGFKHTCVSQMGLHGVRRDVISDYVGTDEATIAAFYQGGATENIDVEIGGLQRKQREPTWRAFVVAMTKVFEQRYNELVGEIA